jgi:hypothetical protein
VEDVFTKGTRIIREEYFCPFCGAPNAYTYTISGRHCYAMCNCYTVCGWCGEAFHGVYSRQICEILCSKDRKIKCLVDGLPIVKASKVAVRARAFCV